MPFNVDLHVHSRYSGDTDSDPEESIIRAIERGLAGICFTEHYYYGSSEPVERLREKYEDAILIFRGVEFSAAEGHCLVFGVDTDTLALRNAPLQELVDVVSRAGGVAIPSHPYRGGNSIGDGIKNISGICAIEGYNGCNMHVFNARAIKAAGALQLPFTGGSDAHAPAEVGSCYTSFEEAVTRDNFISLLKAGRYQGVDIRKIGRKWIF